MRRRAMPRSRAWARSSRIRSASGAGPRSFAMDKNESNPGRSSANSAGLSEASARDEGGLQKQAHAVMPLLLKFCHMDIESENFCCRRILSREFDRAVDAPLPGRKFDHGKRSLPMKLEFYHRAAGACVIPSAAGFQAVGVNPPRRSVEGGRPAGETWAILRCPKRSAVRRIDS